MQQPLLDLLHRSHIVTQRQLAYWSAPELADFGVAPHEIQELEWMLGANGLHLSTRSRGAPVWAGIWARYAAGETKNHIAANSDSYPQLWDDWSLGKIAPITAFNRAVRYDPRAEQDHELGARQRARATAERTAWLRRYDRSWRSCKVCYAEFLPRGAEVTCGDTCARAWKGATQLLDPSRAELRRMTNARIRNRLRI
jgi:hypothetical protein